LPNEKLITEEIFKHYWDGQESHSRSAADLWPIAMKELLLPMPSVTTGRFRHFDRMTGGFRPREFSILCGATGTGKTTLLANWAYSLISQRVPVFVASVETGATDFLKRAISVAARQDINTGDPLPLDSAKRLHIEHSAVFQTHLLQLSLYDSRFRVEKLMSDIAWHVSHHGSKIAFIDNLNFFLEVTNSMNAITEMDRVIHELIIFCKRVDVHLVMVMHPKKTDGGRVESEFDIKGSSTAVQEAHNVFLFNRPIPEQIQKNLATEFDRELKIAKMRRRGKFVGRRIMFNCNDGVSYSEGNMF
jgi:twinkle protein